MEIDHSLNVLTQNADLLERRGLLDIVGMKNILPFVKTKVKYLETLFSEASIDALSYRILQGQRYSLSFLNPLSFTLHVTDIKRTILLRAVCSLRTGKMYL
jgi:hypothetical protein